MWFVKRFLATSLLLLTPSVAVSQAAMHVVGDYEKIARSLSPTGDSITWAIEPLEFAFFKVWQPAWEISESHRRTPQEVVYHSDGSRGQIVIPGLWRVFQRMAHMHCHENPIGEAQVEQLTMYPEYPRIMSAYSVFGVCPTWLLGPVEPPHDEADDIDAEIAPAQVERVRKARSSLITGLQAITKQHPKDGLATGQLVRFLIDAKRNDEATRAAQACAGETWWCDALLAYTQLRNGKLDVADSLFVVARLAMPPNVQCVWNDIGMLLDDKGAEFRKLSCDERKSVAERFWWLSDPLYSEPGNERRTVHDARLVLILLHSSIAVDGRYRWTEGYGFDAIDNTIIRYGWPTYAAWGGKPLDLSHTVWMKMQDKSNVHAPFTTFEYSPGRVHTAPTWNMLANPFAIDNSQWNLDDPGDNYLERRSAAGNTADKLWFPQEHFLREWPLVTLPLGQLGVFRRDSTALVAMAGALSASTLAQLGTGDALQLLRSPNPAEIDTVARGGPDNAGRFVLRTEIPPTPAMLSLELETNEQNGIDLRTRLGIEPPHALSSLNAGEVALSDPVFLRQVEGLNAAGMLNDSILRYMLPTTKLSKQNDLFTVYWESYGFNPNDSLRISIKVIRQSEAGLLRRFGNMLGVTDRTPASISISSIELPNRRIATSTAASRTLDRRTVSLGVAELATGDYELVVRVANTSGSQVAVSSRPFSIAR